MAVPTIGKEIILVGKEPNILEKGVIDVPQELTLEVPTEEVVGVLLWGNGGILNNQEVVISQDQAIGVPREEDLSYTRKKILTY